MTIAVVTDVAHVLRLTNHLNNQRRDVEFCDILLKISAKTTVLTHSCVLSAASPFFRELISSNRKNAYPKLTDTPQTIDLVVPGIGRKRDCMEALTDLLDFIYTGKIELKNRTVDLVDRMAEAFMLSGLSALVKKHVKDTSGKVIMMERKVKGTTKKSGTKRAPPHPKQDIFVETEVPMSSRLPEQLEELSPTEPEGSSNGCSRTTYIPVPAAERVPTKPNRKRQRKLEVPFRFSRPNRSVFTCRQCDFASNDQPAVRQHLLLHPGSSYVCVSCGFVTRYSAKLLSHLRDAGHEHETRCSMCGHVAATAEDLHLHLDSHDHSLPFPCAYCPKRFQSRWGWKTHLRCHTNERPFVCEICDLGFKQKVELKSHMLKHDLTDGSFRPVVKKKNYLCDVCGFRTPYSYRMRMHERQHTGNLFQCPHEGCSHRSNSKYSIQVHLLTHSDQKPFQCEVCGKSFKDPSTLRQHTKKHNLEANLVRCNYCSYKSLRRDKVRRHLANVHSEAQLLAESVEGPPNEIQMVEAHTSDLQSLELCPIDTQTIDLQLIEPLPMEEQIVEAHLVEPQDGVENIVTFYLVQDTSC